MAYVTMEADIDHGRIIPDEPEKLPATGRALLTVLPPTPAPPPAAIATVERLPDWDKVFALLGTMQRRPPLDGLTLERQVRGEWDHRPGHSVP